MNKHTALHVIVGSSKIAVISLGTTCCMISWWQFRANQAVVLEKKKLCLASLVKPSSAIHRQPQGHLIGVCGFCSPIQHEINPYKSNSFVCGFPPSRSTTNKRRCYVRSLRNKKGGTLLYIQHCMCAMYVWYCKAVCYMRASVGTRRKQYVPFLAYPDWAKRHRYHHHHPLSFIINHNRNHSFETFTHTV